MDGLDVRKLAQIVLLTPDGKFHGGPRIGPPRVGIPDIGGEELDEPARRVGSGANSFGSTTDPETTLTTSWAMPLTYKLANDNVLYHAQILLAGKGYLSGSQWIVSAMCGDAVLK